MTTPAQKKVYRVRLKEWRTNYYNGTSRPTIAALKQRINTGILPGSSASGEYIVYCTADYEPTQPLTPKPPPATGNPIADSILQKFQHQPVEA